ncbi:MAG: deoxyribodipyrimidine photo-lyase, partial [Actinomycetota bacterium]
MARHLLWFRRDLRLADHPALLAAGADGAEVVPVFVMDPAFATAGGPRLAFLHDCLRSLDDSLRALAGVGLVIRRGDPVEVVPALADELGADAVFVTRDYAPYGRRRDAVVAERLRASDRHLRGVGTPYAVAPGGVRKDDGTPYAVFTPFSKRWRRSGWEDPYPEPGAEIRWLGAGSPGIDTEPLADRPEPGCALPPAGEAAALDRWTTFLDTPGAADGTLRSRVDAYDELRDRPALAGTSQLSPDLKWGTVHPRTLLADLDATGSGDAG